MSFIHFNLKKDRKILSYNKPQITKSEVDTSIWSGKVYFSDGTTSDFSGEGICTAFLKALNYDESKGEDIT